MPSSETEKCLDRSRILPPETYWASLSDAYPDRLIAALRSKSDARVNAFRPADLPPPQDRALELLQRVAADGWIQQEQHHLCPNPDCGAELTEADIAAHVCPECGDEYRVHGEIETEYVFRRSISTRQVDWVVAIHGMNTTGAWQEEFSWYFSTTWGRAVPVSVYKYGYIIAGVVLPWRRRQLQRGFRTKIAKLRDQAVASGFSGKPDVIAHSFGTWLLGHMLEDELDRPEQDRLNIGRLILAGCVIRPDFDWKRLKDAGIVEEILCHYGTKDPIVPLAHYAIWDSGPSGRRGFDGNEVINIVANDFAHSDVFAVDKYVINGKPLQAGTGDDGEQTQLAHSYQRYWRPFLQITPEEMAGLPDRLDPSDTWHESPWPVRGTILPIFLLPLVLSALLMLTGFLGQCLMCIWPILIGFAKFSAAGLLVLLALVLLVKLKRSIWPP